MWDLNGSPDRRTDDLDEGPVEEYDTKGKQIGQEISLSSSSSSLMIIEDNNNNEDDDNDSSRLFGFSMTDNNNQPVPVTHQFFPSFNDESSSQVGSTRPTDFPTANWVGVRFSHGGGVGDGKVTNVAQPIKKSRRGPRSRSSQYRGVTFYRRTGRWESHIWDCGKQVYLGGFDTAHAAARAYDRAAIKFRGVEADINFTLEDYQDDLKQMTNLSKEEFVHVLRRQSTGFPRGSSKYRGVTLHKCGRWEARMGQFLGKKYVYLGLFDTEVEAAR